MTKKLHWTQTPEGRERMRQIASAKRDSFRNIAKQAVKIKRDVYKKNGTKATSLVVNGWKITLGKDEIRIDHE